MDDSVILLDSPIPETPPSPVFQRLRRRFDSDKLSSGADNSSSLASVSDSSKIMPERQNPQRQLWSLNKTKHVGHSKQSMHSTCESTEHERILSVDTTVEDSIHSKCTSEIRSGPSLSLVTIDDDSSDIDDEELDNLVNGLLENFNDKSKKEQNTKGFSGFKRKSNESDRNACLRKKKVRTNNGKFIVEVAGDRQSSSLMSPTSLFSAVVGDDSIDMPVDKSTKSSDSTCAGSRGNRSNKSSDSTCAGSRGDRKTKSSDSTCAGSRGDRSNKSSDSTCAGSRGDRSNKSCDSTCAGSRGDRSNKSSDSTCAVSRGDRVGLHNVRHVPTCTMVTSSPDSPTDVEVASQACRYPRHYTPTFSGKLDMSTPTTGILSITPETSRNSQMAEDEITARRLQEEMDREFAMSLSRSSPVQQPVDLLSIESLLSPIIMLGRNAAARDSSARGLVCRRSGRIQDQELTSSAASRPGVRRLQRLSQRDEQSVIRRIGQLTQHEWDLHRMAFTRENADGLDDVSANDSLDPQILSYLQFGRHRSGSSTSRRATRRVQHNHEHDYMMQSFDSNDYEALINLAESIGPVMPRGLTESQVSLLPIKPYRLSDGPQQCNICMVDYEENDALRILQCFHYFHMPCIDRWLKENASCPICRVAVVLN